MDQNDILQKYWFLKPDNFIQSNVFALGLDCNDGWYPLIDELCGKIEYLLDTKYPEYKSEFTVLQVKQKFGSLRFYVSGAPDEIFDLVDEYERKSESICEHCGNTPARIRTHRGWYNLLCDDCESRALENEKR
jgi:hypothetical protein